MAHVVLFRPKDGYGGAEQDAFVAAIERARREIP